MTPEGAGKLVEAFAQDAPGAYQLARLVSLAVSIERELLRKVRLALLPEVDAGAEADLWFSPLVETQSPLALVFVPEVADELRARLKRDQPLLKAVWELLAEFHRNAPPALCLEEELTWLALSDTDNVDLIERRLQSVMATMATGTRPGLARWAGRALPALPEKARHTESARILSVVSGVQTGGAPALRELPRTGGGVQTWMSRIMRKSLPRVPVGVRLLEKSPDTRLTRLSADGTMAEMTPGEFPLTLELSYPPNTLARALEVPQTNPLLLEVSWPDGDATRTRQVSLPPGKTEHIDVASTDINIRTALGDIHTLARSYDYDLGIVCESQYREWVDRLVERLKREQRQGRPLALALATVNYMFRPDLNPEVMSDKDDAVMRASRKIALIVSSWNTSPLIAHLAKLRRESSRTSNWLLVISHSRHDTEAQTAEGMSGVSSAGEHQPIIFDDQSESDESYYKLLSAITG